MPEPVVNLSRTNIRQSSDRVVFGDVTYNPKGTCGPRLQPDFQLVIVLEGPSRVQVEGEWLSLRPNEARLFQPGNEEFFAFSEHSATRHIWCAVEPGLARQHLPPLNLPNAIALPYTTRLQSIFQLAFDSPAESDRLNSSILQQLGLAVLGEAAATAQRRGASTPPAPLQRCLRYVSEHFAEAIDQETLARKAGCTPQHLRRLFRQRLKTTPSRYLWDLRLKKGLEMLQSTGLTVSEIAYRVGFQNPFHFSRMMKQRYGEAPLQLRKRSWGRS